MWRDIELEDISGKISWGHHGISFTELGRFAYLHTFNAVALPFAMFAILDFGGFGIISIFLSALTLVLLLLLPVLETTVYDVIPVDDDLYVPISYYHHFNYTAVAAALFISPVIVREGYDVLVGEMPVLYFGLVTALFALISGKTLHSLNRKFLYALQQEIEAAVAD